MASGSFGDVYRPSTEISCASYVCKQVPLSSQTDAEHFEQEVALHKMVCDHPSIVTFYGSDVKALFSKRFGCIYMMSTHHGNALIG